MLSQNETASLTVLFYEYYLFVENIHLCIDWVFICISIREFGHPIITYILIYWLIPQQILCK